MRGVVTGGAGFLGSHIADHLANQGHEVVVYDAKPTTRHPCVIGDLLDPAALGAAFDGMDFVCHLAAVGDVYLAAERPALAASVNAAGTAYVCDAALSAKVRRVVVASTWEVYGPPRYQPIDEQHPCDPDHPYNITKLAGERLALAYADLRSLPVIALRLGTAFGTRMRPNSVFSVFVRKALAGETITIQGTGAQGRQFTHTSDIARAFEAALLRGRPGGVYNATASQMTTIRELAEAVIQRLPTSVVYGDARPGDVPSALISSELAQRELGWRAEKSFEAGLEELIGAAKSVQV